MSHVKSQFLPLTNQLSLAQLKLSSAQPSSKLSSAQRQFSSAQAQVS